MVMSTQDFLNIVLAVGVIFFIACCVYTAYYFVQALKSISGVANNLEEMTGSVKNRIQLKMLATIPSLLVALVSKIIKRRG